MTSRMDVLGLQPGTNGRVWEALASASADQAEARKRVAHEFASLLLFEVMKTMRATIPEGGLFGHDSFSNEIYTTLTDMELARAMAKKESIGMERLIEKALESYGQRSNSGGTNHIRSPAGVVNSGFGIRSDPLTGEERFHKRIDIAAPEGTLIRAAASGTIIYSGRANSYGNMIVVDHGNGLVTRYAHTKMNLLSTGDPVQAGQEIALVGTTGRSTGPHLHFEVLRRGKAVDPQPFLTRIAASGKNDFSPLKSRIL